MQYAIINANCFVFHFDYLGIVLQLVTTKYVHQISFMLTQLQIAYISLFLSLEVANSY